MRHAVLPLALVAAVAVIFSARPIYDPDLFWHLAQGREVLAGHLVHTNQFSATSAAFTQHYTSWAFEAALALIERVMGLGGVQVAQGAMVAAALLALYASVRVRNSRVASVCVLLLSVWVIEPRVIPRPYLVSWLGLALSMYAIERWTALRPLRLPLLLAMMFVWANAHAEVVVGVAAIGLFGLAEYVRPSVMTRRAAGQIVFAAALCTVMTLGSPYGAGLWRYLFDNVGVPAVLRIAELQPPSPQAYPAFFAYLAALMLLIASQPRRLRASEAVLVVLSVAFSLRYIRFTPVLVFLTAPIMASRFDAWVARGWDRRAVVATVIAIVAATAPASPRQMRAAWRVGVTAVAPPEFFSSDAITFAREHQMSGPLFNSMNLGGFISWALPDARVFQDSRLQAYPPEHFATILRAAESPQAWRQLVANVDWAMVSLARPNELSGVGKFDVDEWSPVFRGRAVEILVRRSGRYGRIATPAISR